MRESVKKRERDDNEMMTEDRKKRGYEVKAGAKEKRRDEADRCKDQARCLGRRRERDENDKGPEGEDSERDGSRSAVNAGIIQLGETIGLYLTTVWRGQPHTVP